jgi:hypothetical protein
MSGKMATFYDTEDDSTLFGDFVKSFDPNADEYNYMKVLFAKVLKFFDNKFLLGTEGNKAVSITSQDKVEFGSRECTIWGIFKGGETDMERKVYRQRDALNDIKLIEKDDVPSIDYFYKLWIPYDWDDGILMIQSYTNMGCVASFKEQMENLFISLQYRPMWNRLIPKGFVDRYLKSSVINEIKVQYEPQQTNAQGVFASMSQVRKETTLSRLSIKMKDLFQMDNYESELRGQIENVVEKYNPITDKVIVFYRDEAGKEAHASLDNLEGAMPTISLPDSLKNKDTQMADADAMNIYTKELLDEIKTQIGYKPNKIQ